MSTKIYGGMISTGMNPFSLHKKIRKVVEPIFHAKFAETMALLLEHKGEKWGDVIRDIRWTSPRYSSFGETAIVGNTIDISERLYGLIVLLQRDPMHTFTDLDFGYDAILLPNGRGLKHKPLVLLFSERAGDEYREALIEAGVVQEYHYQNQSDQPSEISEAEWDQRRQAWSALDIPARDGLSISMPSRFESWYTYARRDNS